MRKSWIGLAAIIILAGILYGREAWAQAGGSEAEEGNLIYVVQPYDTLWDVAGRFLNSPYYWPKIWERNSFIIDPDLIFPGDVLNLYPEGEKLAPEIETVPKLGETREKMGEEAEVVKTPEGQVAKVIYKEASSVGWIEVKDFEKAGKIAGTLDDRGLIGAQDTVYVDIGSAGGAKEGDLFSVFRVAEEIRHPITRKKLGYKIITLGELEITKLTETGGMAEVVKSYQEMKEGDFLRPYLPPLTAEVPIIKSQKKLDGYIVANKKQTPSFAKGDIVYIDLGKAAGIEPGNMLEVYIPGKVFTENRVKKQMPDRMIGQVVVIDPRENTAVALVTVSVIEFKIGQRVRMTETP